MRQFDLGDLYMQAFGVKMPDYDLKSENAGLKYPQSGASFNESQLPKGKFGSSAYYKQDSQGRYYFLPVTLGDVDLPYPIIRIQSRKYIVETQMTERKGSVIELISQDNWKIYIRGFIINHDRQFPEDEIAELINLYERNESLVIKNVLTDIALAVSDKVKIADLNFPEVRGVEYVKPYEINLISDSIFDLEIA